MIKSTKNEPKKNAIVQFFEVQIPIKVTKHGFMISYPSGKGYTSPLYDTKEEASKAAQEI